jgi:hypothetical protein
MTTIAVQEMIDKMDTLSVDDLDYLLDIIRQKSIEKRRLEIAKNGQAILEDLKQGKAKIGTVNDLITDLLSDEENDNESSLE